MTIRSIPVGNTSNQKDGYRELVITNVDKDKVQPLHLVVLEPASFHAKESYYRIPLGESAPNNNADDITLVPIIPEIETIKEIEADESYRIDEGYVYVFRNRKLWRELKAVGNGYLSDVNLRRLQGKNKRPATGDRDRYIILPYIIDGKEQDIHLAYSTVQWGWRYICALGGMDETNDSRYREKLHSGKKYGDDYTKVKLLSSSEFEQRLQKADLSQWQASDVTVAKDDRQPRMQSVNKGDTSYHRQIHQGSGLNVITLADPVGTALSLAAEYQAQRTTLVDTQEHIETQVANAIDKNNPTPQETSIHAATFQTAAFLVSYVYHNEQDDLQGKINKDKLDTFLENKHLIAQVEEIKKIKQRLIDHVNDITSPVNFTTALKDVFALEGTAYITAWDIMGNVIQLIKGSPAAPVAHLMTDIKKLNQWKNEDQSEDLLLALAGIHPSGTQHPLSKFLFPPKTTTTNKATQVSKDQKTTVDPVNPLFNYDKMLAISESDSLITLQKSVKLLTGSLEKFFIEYLKFPELVNSTDAKKAELADAAKDHQANKAALANSTKQLDRLNKKYDDLTAQHKAQTEYRQKQVLKQATLRQQNKSTQTVDADINKTNNKLETLKRNQQIVSNQQQQATALQSKLRKKAAQSGSLHAVFADVKGNHLDPVIKLADSAGLLKDVEKDSHKLTDFWKNGLTTSPDHSRITDVLLGADKDTPKKSALRNQINSPETKLPLYDPDGHYLTHVNGNTVLDQDTNLAHVLTTAKTTGAGSSAELALYSYKLKDATDMILQTEQQLDKTKTEAGKQRNWKAHYQTTIDNIEKRQVKLKQAVSKFKSRNAGASIATTSVMLAVLDLWNLIETVKKIDSKDIKTFADSAGGLLDVAAGILSATDTLKYMHVSKLTDAQMKKAQTFWKKKYIYRQNIPKSMNANVTRVSYQYVTRSATVIASGFALGLSIWDFIRSMNKDDTVGMVGHSLMATGALMTMITALGIATLGIGALVITIVAFFVLLFADSKLDTWLLHSVFGTKAGDNSDPKYQAMIDDPEKAYIELMNLLQGPSIDIQQTMNDTLHKMNMHTVQISVNTPGFVLGKSTLERELEYWDYVKEKWIRFDLLAGGKSNSKTGIDIQKIWHYASIHLLKDKPGYKIELPALCSFGQLRQKNPVDKLNNIVKIRMRVRSHPNGKQTKAFNNANLNYTLPLMNPVVPVQPKNPKQAANANKDSATKNTVLDGWAVSETHIKLANLTENDPLYLKNVTPKCDQIQKQANYQSDNKKFS